jgi:hypothetical protein
MENPTTDASVAQKFGAGPEQTNRNRVRPETSRRATTLDELEEQFTVICGQFQRLVVSAGAEMCAKPPSADSWSAAECLRHLSLSADAYFPVWQQVIATAGPRKTEMNAPYQMDFWGRFLSWMLEPPPRVRSKTPAPFVPVNCGQVAEVLDGFLERQERIVAALRRCRGRAVDQVKIASPIDSRIRYSIWSSFVVNAAHQRRHLWQAEQAVAKLRALI